MDEQIPDPVTEDAIRRLTMKRFWNSLKRELTDEEIEKYRKWKAASGPG